jgi:hypothetical protein
MGAAECGWERLADGQQLADPGRGSALRAWQVVTKVRGLAVRRQGNLAWIYGLRTLSQARQSGYQMEGRVSVGGKRCRAFTSSMMFEREDGSLCNVAVLEVCW